MSSNSNSNGYSNSNSHSNSYSYTASSYSSSSFSQSSSANPQGTTARFTESMTSNDRDGTRVYRTHEETGKPTLEEREHLPARGEGGITSGGGVGRIEDVSDQDQDQDQDHDQDHDQGQAERDRLYEERMEDEYAKREGGA